MLPLIDDTAKDFVVRIKNLLEAKYKENSKENGLHNLENNNFSNGIVNTNKTEQKSEEINKNQKEYFSAKQDTQNDKVIYAFMNGLESKNIHVKTPTLVDLNKKGNEYICGNAYSIVNKNVKGKEAPTDVNHNEVEEEENHVNGNILHNEEDKENHYGTNDIKEHKNMNGKNKNAKGKANSDENVEQKLATSKVFPLETNNIKKELHDIRDVISATVDSEKLVGGYTADAIVPCAFGLKSKVMYNDKDPFAVALQAFYEMSVFNVFEK